MKNYKQQADFKEISTTKVILYILLIMAFFVLPFFSSFLTNVIFSDDDYRVYGLHLARFPVSILLFWLSLKYIFKRNWSSFLIKKPDRYLAVSIIIGLALPFITLLFYKISNSVSCSNLTSNFHAISFTFWLASSFSVAVIEEFIFRGFLYTVIKEKWNTFAAVFFPSILFALIHLANIETITILNVGLLLFGGLFASVMFYSAVITTKNIWSGVFVHFLWNAVFSAANNTGFGFIQIAAKEKLKDGIMISCEIVSKNTIFTGADFGFEVSFPAIITYVIGIGFFLFLKKINNSNLNCAIF